MKEAKFQGMFKRLVTNEDGVIEVTLAITNMGMKSLLDELNKEKYYNITLKERKNDRTLKQNSFFWKILTLIAEASDSDQDKWSWYLAVLEEANAKFSWQSIIAKSKEELDDIIKSLKQVFRAVDFKGQREGFENEYVVKCYYGSSHMNTKQMNELIDIAIQWAYEKGIDVEAYRHQYE